MRACGASCVRRRVAVCANACPCRTRTLPLHSCGKRWMQPAGAVLSWKHVKAARAQQPQGPVARVRLGGLQDPMGELLGLVVAAAWCMVVWIKMRSGPCLRNRRCITASTGRYGRTTIGCLPSACCPVSDQPGSTHYALYGAICAYINGNMPDIHISNM